MNATAQLGGQLVELEGVDFRDRQVSCPTCRWQGVVGRLFTPSTSKSDGSVVYACPECGQHIARHPGLRASEVLEELAKIRRELAAEMAQTLQSAGEGGKALPADIDFARVRAALPDA